MLARILIGLDVPNHVNPLTDLGIRWAKQFGATLVGLGIVDEPGIRAIEPAWPVGGKPGRDPIYYMGYEARLADVHRQADEVLEQFATQCIEKGVAHAEVKAVGSPHERIAEEAQSCDLILLARGSHFRFIAGDVEGNETLKRVLKDAPRPIVNVPAKIDAGDSIVVAYDGSLQSARALASFQASGLGESGKVHVVSIDASANEAARRCERARAFLSYHNLESVAHTLPTSTPPEQVILDQIRDLNAGLVVMGAYGQPVLREFFVGSVTRKLLEKSPVPLFLDH
jgi:nucleotide-binding universal stress UspA family protein